MATSGGRVRLREALDPLVLAIDIGSTASRGDVFDTAGRPVECGRHKIPHLFMTDRDGTSEIDPDQTVGEVHQIIRPWLPSEGSAGLVALPWTRSPPRRWAWTPTGGRNVALLATAVNRPEVGIGSDHLRGCS
jgi:hypothetical protein